MNLQEHSSAHDCPSPRNSSIPPRPLPAAVTSALTRGPRCLPRFQQLHRNLHGQTAQRPGHLRDPAGLRGPRGLDVGAVPAAVGRPAAPPGHPRQPRHHELQPEPGVTRVPHAAQSAARPQQGAALRHAARGAAVGGHADAGRGWAAGRGRALLGPVRGAHAGRRGAEPALRAHGVLGRAGGGRTHGRLRVAGAAPTRGRGPGVQGLRGAQRGAARLPGRLRGQHLRGAAVPPRGRVGSVGTGVHMGQGCGGDPWVRPAEPRAPQEIPTLRQLWARGQQVLVSYEDEAAVSRHPELWPGLPRWTGAEVKGEELGSFLDSRRSCGRPGSFVTDVIGLNQKLLWG
ncbi:PI-PLC X domain-containing protein 1 isoform X4 [Cavia porcellus]|uniref:PI-PLC X domain-containing protein 1 isoform X4 n=1 Tax=Cavia porcellus TaxID=10141 RepID=UPI002FE294B6